MLSYSKQFVNEEDISAVVKVLKSKILTKGKKIIEFENKISKFVNSKYAVAVSSASSALHLSCMALQLKKNEIFWTVPNTFVASATCGIHCGALVDFVDIDPLTKNISIEEFENKLKKTKKHKLPKVVIPVHFGGQPTDQEAIYDLSKKYKFRIIEDASHSLGAKRFGEKVGSCKWSDLTVFSFHPVKPITTAEGGVITTNNFDYYIKLKQLRDHGIYREKKSKKKGFWYYEQRSLGFNYRLNELQAALGISQLKKLNTFNNYRNNAAKFYFDKLKKTGLKLPLIKKNNKSSFHLFSISFDKKKIKNNYQKIYKKFITTGIYTNLHYLPVHLHPLYKKMGFKKGDYPIAEEHAKTSFSLPLYYGIKKIDQLKVIKCINKILEDL
ncbi:UDP-4-amino-4,6-dideoxy-N-acetyl-beta-L-altrosamine transaminase [Pelagibacterales bacterium SAG-MED38]|nr:UDP-4-amino-4,6-dideoxy-N-acetyl-beta-L-altrosamine transaminase [Pelagibacterales bacterium SAG-MED38]